MKNETNLFREASEKCLNKAMSMLDGEVMTMCEDERIEMVSKLVDMAIKLEDLNYRRELNEQYMREVRAVPGI